MNASPNAVRSWEQDTRGPRQAALQFSCRFYYGWWTALPLAFQFLVFALFFVASRRTLPIITAHARLDLYALLRLWVINKWRSSPPAAPRGKSAFRARWPDLWQAVPK